MWDKKIIQFQYEFFRTITCSPNRGRPRIAFFFVLISQGSLLGISREGWHYLHNNVYPDSVIVIHWMWSPEKVRTRPALCTNGLHEWQIGLPNIGMTQCNTVVSLLIMLWRYCSFDHSHLFIYFLIWIAPIFLIPLLQLSGLVQNYGISSLLALV